MFPFTGTEGLFAVKGGKLKCLYVSSTFPYGESITYLIPNEVNGFLGDFDFCRADKEKISLSICFNLLTVFLVEDWCLFLSYSFPVFIAVFSHGCIKSFFKVSLSSGFHLRHEQMISRHSSEIEGLSGSFSLNSYPLYTCLTRPERKAAP